MIKIRCLALVLIGLSANVKAYDVTTHAMLTYQAYLQSDLSKQPLLQSLGIEYYLPKDKPFADTYFDIKEGVVKKRKNIELYEDDIIRNKLKQQLRLLTALDLPAWLMRGAVREDDGSYELRKLKWIQVVQSFPAYHVETHE